MKTKILAVAILAVGLLCPFHAASLADQAPCARVSAGAETDAVTASVLNVGQALIGRADNGVIFMQASAMGCTSIQVPCLIGDVDGNGVIDGLDIQSYVRVTLTGIGTPRELCAANVGVAPFVGLLLAP